MEVPSTSIHTPMVAERLVKEPLNNITLRMCFQPSNMVSELLLTTLQQTCDRLSLLTKTHLYC